MYDLVRPCIILKLLFSAVIKQKQKMISFLIFLKNKNKIDQQQAFCKNDDEL
jgi:hypothetical protein